MLNKKQHEEFLNSLPPEIKEVAIKYPPGAYKVIEGAPYAISAPGTRVWVLSYLSNGNINVVVGAKDKLPSAIQHEKELGEKNNKSKLEIEKLHASNVQVEIEPKWLEPLPDVSFEELPI